MRIIWPESRSWESTIEFCRRMEVECYEADEHGNKLGWLGRLKGRRDLVSEAPEEWSQNDSLAERTGIDVATTWNDRTSAQSAVEEALV